MVNAGRPEQVEMHRAGFFGDHPLRDKEHHHLASRKCRRESTPQPRQKEIGGARGRETRPQAAFILPSPSFLK